MKRLKLLLIAILLSATCMAASDIWDWSWKDGWWSLTKKDLTELEDGTTLTITDITVFIPKDGVWFPVSHDNYKHISFGSASVPVPPEPVEPSDPNIPLIKQMTFE